MVGLLVRRPNDGDSLSYLPGPLSGLIAQLPTNPSEPLGWQRSSVTEMNHQTEYGKELIRKYFALIDLEEYKVREKLVQE